jgi:hypothetical protein
LLWSLWQLRPLPRRGLRTLRRARRLVIRRLKKGVKFSFVLSMLLLLLFSILTYSVQHAWEFRVDPVERSEQNRVLAYYEQMRDNFLLGKQISTDWGVVHLQRAFASISPEYRARLEARHGSLEQLQGPVTRAKQAFARTLGSFEDHVHHWRAEFLRDKYVWPAVLVLPAVLWFYNRAKYLPLFGFSAVTTGLYWLTDPNLKAYFNQPISVNTVREVAQNGERLTLGDRTAEYAARLRARVAAEQQRVRRE